MSYASRSWGHSLSKKINSRLIRRTQRRFLLRVIKGYKTISYEAVFAISGIPPIDLVILNNLDVQSILFYLDCDIHFSYVWCHSGNLSNDRADQLAKEATCQDVNLLMSVPLETFSLRKNCFFLNTEFLVSPKALWTKRVLELEVNEDNIEELIMGHEDELTTEELQEILNEEHQETHRNMSPSEQEEDERGPIPTLPLKIF
ncbi:uncharacterized protein TNCV_561561 [Trichonephila clavipes]|uniref:RNase H type-1 domain-containing protein n=1 Tax=Trichonephila clavipes TaxID=2585209 RepID=A0A8X6S1B5_TRICX|nr:uncharacterized protein TNCV_561561 [Trichonephila clavipes]